jgi:hypothetical protein
VNVDAYIVLVRKRNAALFRDDTTRIVIRVAALESLLRHAFDAGRAERDATNAASADLFNKLFGGKPHK